MRCWQGDGRRLWALAVQLYALRSARNWGHGDFTDLAKLIEIAGVLGASAIGLNPLHALFPERPGAPSPYAPNSRLFLNPLYIDVEAVPEFPGVVAAGLSDELPRLRESHLIDYEGVARAKLHALQLAYEQFAKTAANARRSDFEAYRAEQGEALLRFACFEVLRQMRAPKPWREWPEPWRSPDRAALEAFRRQHLGACEFQEFMQWIADRQLAACVDAARKVGMPIGLYTDLAVGIDPAGADAWSRQDAVVTSVHVGAPPDEFNPAGQDWGLAPFNPMTLSQDDFAPLRQLMRAAMRHAGAIRLDHVMGLKRVFMIPQGLGASDGTYVRYPFEPLLRVIGEESCRFRCIVVGEDLGTVPEGFRDTTAKWGVWTYRVILFEREGDGRFRPPEHYPPDAVATFNTHDLPSLQGWLNGHDLKVKRGLGIDPGESEEARVHAQHMLRATLGERAPREINDDPAAIASFLGATPSKLAVIGLDDVLGEIEQVNVPGTTDEHPNWRRKLTVPLEQLPVHEGLQRVAGAFTQAGRNYKS
ncbi:4-alpha-glucanotransferase [Microbacteriaceae bacterium K1510]|nr:4-alpha-glucanotransferase [Microbacteriaceae bacterium K1510]